MVAICRSELCFIYGSSGYFALLPSELTSLLVFREFLPLQCFDDRDLKTAQRQQKFSYREFIDNDLNTSDPNRIANGTFGTGKRGQPLKIIVRNSEPKADMILNVLVCHLTNERRAY